MKYGYGNRQRFLSLIMSAVLMFATLSCFGITASAKEYDMNDPSVFPELNISFTNQNGDTIQSGDTIRRGDTIKFNLTYRLVNTLYISGDDTFVYSFPPGVTIQDNTASNDIIDPNGNMIVGHYYIETRETADGEQYTAIIIDLDNEVTVGADTHGNLSASMTFDRDKAATEGQGSFEFPGLSAPFTFDFEDRAETFYKNLQGVDENGYITYQIQIKPDANYKDFTVEDALGSNLELVDGSITLHEGWGNTPEPLDPGRITTTADGFELDLGGAMEYNHDYFVQYKVKVKDPSADSSGNENTATYYINGVKGTDNNDTSVKVERSGISKSASGSFDGSGKITWTINVNTGYVRGNLKGATVQDSLPDGLYVDSVMLKNNKTGEETQLDNATCVNGGDFSYTFPDEDDYGSYSFVITTSSTIGEQYQNIADITWEDGTKDTSGTAWGSASQPGTQPTPVPIIEKDNVSANDDTGRLEWKITLDADKIKGKSNLSVRDYHSGAGSGNNWEVSGRFNWIDDLNSVNIVYRPAAGQPKTLIKNTDYTVREDGSDYGTNRFRIDFNGNYNPMPNDMTGTIEITYSSQFDEQYKDYATTYDLTNYAEVYENEWNRLDSDDAKAELTNEIILEKKVTSSTYDEESKSFVFEWDIHFNRANPSSMTWDYTGKDDYGSTPVTLKDVFDTPGMEYVPNSANLFGGGNWGTHVAVTVDKDASGKQTGISYTIQNPGKNAYQLNYRTRIPVSALVGTDISGLIEDKFTAKNTVTALQGEDVIDTDSAEKEVSKGFIDKRAVGHGGSGNNAYGVDYTVKINETGSDLNPSGNYLEMTDVIPKNVTLDLDSVKVYSKYNSVTDNELLTQGTYQVAYNGKTRTLRVTIEDRTPAVVKYYVGLSGALNENVTVANNAKLRGVYSYNSAAEGEYIITQSNANASADFRTITLIKTDQDDIGKYLGGAEYMLGAVDVQKYNNDDVFELIDQQTLVTSDGTNGQPLGYAKSSESLTADVLYCFYEVKAPEEYTIDDTMYFFAFVGKDAAEKEQWWNESFGSGFVDERVTLINENASYTARVTDRSETPPTPFMEPEPEETPSVTLKPRVTPTPSATPSGGSNPTATPTASPTAAPTATPTASPTAAPTSTPTSAPTATPGGGHSNPTATPTISPTAAPTASPTAAPTSTPTAAPTATPGGGHSNPTATPTISPTAAPTASPTAAPTATPTSAPTATPGGGHSNPTTTPTISPTAVPTATPTVTHTAGPTAAPTASPSASPTATRRPGGVLPHITPKPDTTPAPAVTPSTTGTPVPADSGGTPSPAPAPTVTPDVITPQLTPYPEESSPPVTIDDNPGGDDQSPGGTSGDQTAVPPDGGDENPGVTGHEYRMGPATVNTPKTGDSNSLMLWLTLTVLFAAGAVYSFLNAKRSGKRK